MNGFDMLNAMGGIDERFICEYSALVPRKGGRLKRAVRTGVIIAAAAVIFAIPAGAFYSQFVHKAAVQKYFTEGSVEYLEEHGLALNFVDENEHVRLTVDTLLSDGHIGSMILTIEGLDEEGLQCVEKQPFEEIYLKDAETGEYVVLHDNGSSELVGGGEVDHDTCTGTQYTIRRELQLDQIDTDKDYILTFGMNARDPNAERDEHHVLIDNVMEGIEFATSFRPNVAVKELESEDGERIWLSQIGFYSSEQGVINKLRNHNTEMRLIRKDGFFKDEVGMNASTLDWSPERPQPLACGWFDSIVEIDKYDGIEINGVSYLEKE